jgi:hypothetical protein
MRKPLTSRILGLTAIYCAVFILLVVLQFSKKEEFTLSAGAMTIRGNYLQSSENRQADDKQHLDGVTLFFGGLEFSLKNRGKVLTIKNDDNIVTPVNPDSMALEDDRAVFTLPGGTQLLFISADSPKGIELQITAYFADDISEITIPITPRRSSLVNNSGKLGISYNGMLYMFARTGNELEYGKITLTKDNNICAYRSGEKQKIFQLADYMLAEAYNPNDYEAELNRWRNQIFADWNQNPALLRTEEDVTAYCGESLFHSRYNAAVSSIPAEFLRGSQHGYYSSAYIGGMPQAYRRFTAAERERTDIITRLINAGSPGVLQQDHIIEFLLTRGMTALAANLSEILREINPEDLLPEHCCGVFETYFDFIRGRMNGANPAEHLIDKALTLLSENLNRDISNNNVYFSFSESIDYIYSLKLGKALVDWAVSVNNNEWAVIGRSLVISAFNSGISASRLYCTLSPHNYFPKALPVGTDNIWVWTVSPGVSGAYQDGNLNISFNFQENMAHFIIIRNIRPFLKIQIHNMDFRSDSQFETYDSSGWIYYSQDNILVIKLKHRSVVENIRIFYRAETPPAPAVNVSPAAEAAVE